MSEEAKNGKWVEMIMNMGKSYNGFIVPNKSIEPFIQMTKVQQQQYLNMSRSWIDHLQKICDASHSGDAKKVRDAYMESQSNLFKTCQEALKEQATARYEFMRTLMPSMSSFTSTEA